MYISLMLSAGLVWFVIYGCSPANVLRIQAVGFEHWQQGKLAVSIFDLYIYQFNRFYV